MSDYCGCAIFKALIDITALNFSMFVIQSTNTSVKKVALRSNLRFFSLLDGNRN